MGYSLFLFLIYISLCSLAVIFFIRREGKGSPILIPITFFILYEVVKLSFYSDANQDSSEIIDANIFYLLWSTSCFVCFCLGYLLFRRRISEIRLKGVRQSVKVPFVLVFFGLVVQVVYFFIKTPDFNIFFFFQRRLGSSEVQQLVASSYMFVILSIAVIYLSIIGMINSSRRKAFSFLLVLLTSLMLLFLFNGSRGPIIYPLLFAVYYYLIRNKVKPYQVILLAIAVLYGFAYLGQLRSRDARQSQITLEETSIVNYQKQLRDETVLVHFQNAQKIHGASYLNIVTFFIPRSILGDLKPVFLDGYLAKEVWGMDNVGMPVNSFTESFVNLGYLGFVVMIIFGILFGVFVEWIQKSNAPFALPLIFGLFFAGNLYSTYLVYAIQYSVVAMTIHFFINKIR